MFKYFVAAAILTAAAASHAETDQGCGELRSRMGLQTGALMSEEKLKALRERVAADKAMGDLSIALMHICGAGVKKDVEEGVRLLEKAHAEGNARAVVALVWHYFGMLETPLDPVKLLYWVRIGADAGQPEFQSALAAILIQGTIVKKDDTAAERLFLKAVAQGFVKGYAALGSFYFSKQNYAEAIRWFELGAVLGDPGAHTGLGALYAGGFGVTRDHAKALTFWKIAAEKKSAAAQFGMATLYANGWGVARDDAQAVQWFQLAAKQGFAGAQAALANAYEFGNGVPVDAGAAQNWRKIADQSARAAAQNGPRRMYPDCCDGEPEQTMADVVKWYRLDAETGDAERQLIFARFLFSNKKTQEAIVWLERAATQGHAHAMAELGAIYLSGYGLSANPELGLKYTRLAAEQGIASARIRLADIYQKGIFVHQSLIAAYALYFNAATAGKAPGQLLNTYRSPIDELMSEADIARAQQLIRNMATSGSFLTALDNASAH